MANGHANTPTLAELQAEARRRWWAWAEDLAAGRAGPHPHAVLEVAAILEIRSPGEALELAAKTVRQAGPIQGLNT